MKAYFVDIQVTETKTYEKRIWFSANSDEEAELLAESNFDHKIVEIKDDDFRPVKRMSVINAVDSIEDYEWQTEKWRDVEEMYLDTMYSYLNRSEEEIKNEEGEHWKGDAEFYLDLAKLLEEERFKQALEHFLHADTWLRDGVPSRVIKLFQILNS